MNLLRHLPRFREASRVLPELAARERWQRGEIEAFQLERLNAVWSHAIEHVPHYRRVVRETRESSALPDRFRSLEEFRERVPVLNKGPVRSAARMFLSDRAERGTWRRTGGSTGLPMEIYWATTAHRASLRTQYRFVELWNLDPLDREAYVWGHSARFRPGWRGRLEGLRQPVEDSLRGRLRLSAYRLGRADVREYLRKIARFRPASVYGYSSAIDLVAREAVATDFHCSSLKLFRLTGEPAPPHIIQRIERHFAVPAVVEYGSHECGITAYEFPDRTLRIREDRIFAETVRRSDGRYDILLTVLDNPSFPLLRYAIEDVTDAPLERPAQGFSVLSNVAGRSNDLLLTRSGAPIHSARILPLLIHATRVVRRFRIHQCSDGALEVSLELDNPLAAVDLTRLERDLSELVEGYPITIEVVERLARTRAGKHRMVTSALADGHGDGLRSSR